MISIAPNPGSGLYYIDSPYELATIEVINAQGISITTLSNVDSKFVNLDMLSSGYYILLINLKDGQQISKPIMNIRD